MLNCYSFPGGAPCADQAPYLLRAPESCDCHPRVINALTEMNVKRKAASSISAAVASPSAPKKLKQGSLTAFFGAPSASKSLHTSPKIAFDKSAWIKTLTPPQRDLLQSPSFHVVWTDCKAGNREFGRQLAGCAER
jgi:hypothetical protein